MAETLKHLQTLLLQKGYDAYLVPRADVFFGEEVRPGDERLAAISGFKGSAGLAVVRARGQSTLLLDGRYSAQAKADLEGEAWTVVQGTLETAVPDLTGLRLAYDPWLFTPDQLRPLAHLEPAPVAEPDNLIDQIWQDRPAVPQSAPYDLPPHLTGETSQAKRQRIANACQGRSLLITQPDSLAWLMNWRGHDLPTTPTHLAFAILNPDGEVQVFAPEDRAGLLGALDTISALGADSIQYDPTVTSQALGDAIAHHGDSQGVAAPCPIRAAKAVKNTAEIAAMRAAHQVDGQAVTAFLTWFAAQDKTELNELDLSHKLAAFRAEADGYAGPSFETISGSGPNGALPHYRVDEVSNRRLQDGDFIVLDSGGQYPGATTDVTRTLAVGTVSEVMRRNFTLVLQGMINLTLQQFPVGTTGHQLDVLARAALWNVGLNYNHGTGHGVGAGLSVHEAPPNVSPMARTPTEDWALKPGMIFSNEPGYYQVGAYGIRCENLLLVVERAPGWLGFETLTQVPFDETLVDWALLHPQQVEWLREYQERTRSHAM